MARLILFDTEPLPPQKKSMDGLDALIGIGLIAFGCGIVWEMFRGMQFERGTRPALDLTTGVAFAKFLLRLTFVLLLAGGVSIGLALIWDTITG